MADQKAETSRETQLKLNLSIGSRLIPILLVALVVVFFVVKGLKPGFETVVETLGIADQAPSPVKLKFILDALSENSELRPTIKEKNDALGFQDWTTKVAVPFAKGFLEEMTGDFYKILKSFFQTVLQLGLYALIPGLAGLIYRRSFWSWFIPSFAILYAVNASEFLGTPLIKAETMPDSGGILLFLAGQVLLLLLINRLRRYSNSSPSPVPTNVYNIGLATVLALIGYACFKGWGPGYVAAVYGEDPAVGVQTVVSSAQRSWIWTSLINSNLLYRWEFILFVLPLIYTLFRSAVRWEGRAPKNIVVLLDGTSNTPDQVELGRAAQTNVFKLFRMLKSDGNKSLLPGKIFDASLYKKYDQKQIAFYYAGVGNKYDNDPITQIFGLAGGMGADAMIERAYLDIMRVYRPGDRVFIAGFSRGAAITRLLARAIDERGTSRAVWTIRLFGRHRTLWSVGPKQPVPISVIGCWDTVGSFGIGKTIGGINFQQMNMFKDLTVPENVERAYHMVALDERRDSFEPTLMDPDPIRPERIVEVWFCGDHANIGGGWSTDRLSDVTMDFLLRHISSGYATDATSEPGNEAWGLYLSCINGETVPGAKGEKNEDGIAIIHPDPLGQLRSWFSMIYNYRPRKMPLHAVISETVFKRMTKAVPAYAPESLSVHIQNLDDKRDTIEADVARLMETNALSAEERDAILKARNTLQMMRWPQHQEHMKQKYKPEPPVKLLSNSTAQVLKSRVVGE